ncbi:MAG TPA: aminotransferase class I/II-fold pyridoxal phosphate-dependent enzyme, partial [Gemmatimonadaceae bacterium]
YLFIRVGEASIDNPDPGTRFAHRLLEEFNVAVVPGAAFGTPEWIRLSYAAPVEDVLEGVRRVIRAGIS